MPIYEYRCNSCGAFFARLQSIANPPPQVLCPTCESDHTERLLSTFAAGPSSTGAGSYGPPGGCGPAGGG